MTEQEVLSKIEQAHETNRRVEARIRNILYVIIASFGVSFIGLFGSTMVLKKTVEAQGEQLDKIQTTYVSYEGFFLFNRTYELQLEETQASLHKDMDRLKSIQKKYRELRSMITTKRRQYRGAKKGD